VTKLRCFFRNMGTALVGAILATEMAVDGVISAGLRRLLDENINQSERNLWGIGLEPTIQTLNSVAVASCTTAVDSRACPVRGRITAC
jgi:hypothetical protein